MDTPKESPQSPLLLDLSEACAYLGAGCSVNTLRRLIASGELRHVKLGKKFAVTREDLQRWVATHATRAGR